MAPPDIERKLAAILAADVAGYSRLMGEDEAATVDAISRCRAEVERIVPEHRGRLVDFTGDAFLAEFPTATDAAACAVAIQGAVANDAAARRTMLRLGLHLGEVRVEEGRLFGAGVNIAARLEKLSDPGGLCVSAVVRDQLHPGSELSFESLGPQRLKNIPGPVEAFRATWDSDRAPAPPASGPSVAVLPFANMSADPDQDFFADGMAEELINALTRVEGLRVIARTSAFSFKGSKADIATIGSRLGVGHVVEGSVRKAGSRLRITAQLVDVEGGHHLWSENFDRNLEDVFEIQDEIARTVVEKIVPTLMGEGAPALVQPTTRSLEAYELFLRAGDRLWRHEPWDTRTAIELLKEATSIDPDYADGWARLAWASSQMLLAFDDDPRWFTEAQEAVQRSFALNPDGAEAHAAHGRIAWTPQAGFQNEAALRSLSRALELQPGLPDALGWHATILYHNGLLDEAREGLEAALAMKPDDPMILNGIAQAAWYQGRYDEAVDLVAKTLQLAPGFFFTHLVNSVIWVYVDELDRAERAIATARGLLGDEPLLDANEALLWAKRGDEAKTFDAIDRSLQDKRSFAHNHHAQHHRAAALALLDRKDEAIAQLRLATGCGLPNHPLFAGDPHLAPLREEPAMQKLLAELAENDAALRAEFGGGTRRADGV